MIKPSRIKIIEPSLAGRITGAGDLVALVAQPVARAIDKIVGTKFSECGGCKKRREKLNDVFPLAAEKNP